jgi:hypothetical protein
MPTKNLKTSKADDQSDDDDHHPVEVIIGDLRVVEFAQRLLLDAAQSLVRAAETDTPTLAHTRLMDALAAYLEEEFRAVVPKEATTFRML